MKRLLKIFAISIAVLLVLVVGGTFLAASLIDLDKVVNQQVAALRPELEQKLGRKVQVGPVTTRLFPNLGGRVEKIVIGPDTTRPTDDRPLLQIDAVGFEVAVWKALLSFGRQVPIKVAYVDGLKVSLVRERDGRLSYQDILDRQPQEAPAAEPKADEPLSPKVQELLRGISIGEIRLKDAEIRLADHGTPTGAVAESYIRKLNVRLEDVRLSDPIRVHVDAAIFSQLKNFELDVVVGPLPADLKVDGLVPIERIALKANAVELAKLAAYAGPEAPNLQSALFSADWSIGPVQDQKPFGVAGFFELKSLQLKGGAPFDVRLDSKLEVDLKSVGVEVENFDLRLGSIAIAARGSALDLAKAPRFKDFTVRSTTLSPAALASYLPQVKASLPPGAKLDGAASLDVRASGDANRQTVQGAFDLTALDLMLPGQFVKPAGVPLGLRVDGDFSKDQAELRGLSFQLDELDAVLKGTVKDFANPRLDLVLSAKPFRFDRLARLAPSVQQSLAASKTTASGNGTLAGHVKGGAKNLDAKLDLGLLGVKLDVPGTRLDGDLRFVASVQGDPTSQFNAQLLFDLDKALIQVQDLVNKAPSTPALVELSAARAGERLTVQKLRIHFAELRLDASGSFDLGKGATSIALEMPRLDLEKFAKTVTAIPADKARGGFVDAKLALSGNPNALETMALALSPLNVRYGRSDLRGVMTVSNLVAPQAEMTINSERLDVDELLGLAPPAPEGAPKAEAPPAKPREDDPSLKSYRFTGLFDARRITVKGRDLQDFHGRMTLADGVLKLEDCTFRIYGGTVSAKGTEAEIWKGRMPFKANLAIKGIELAEAIAENTRYGKLLQGKGDLDIQVSGEGFETTELEDRLIGDLNLAFNEGRFARASITDAVFGDLSALEKIPGLKLQALRGENALKNVMASLTIRDGKMTFKKPVQLLIDGNRTVLAGAIGIAGKLFLDGDYFLSPAAIATATGGRCSSNEELKVPVGIRGTLDQPQFAPNGKAVAGALADRCLKQSATQAVGKVLDDQAKKAGLESARAAEEKARAEAERLRAEADKARAEAERVRLEAEQRAREAAAKQQEAAKKQLQDKAKKTLKGFGF